MHQNSLSPRDYLLVYYSEPCQDCVRGVLCSLLCTLHGSLHLRQVGVKCPHSALVMLIHTHSTLTWRSLEAAKQAENQKIIPSILLAPWDRCAIAVDHIPVTSHTQAVWVRWGSCSQPAQRDICFLHGFLSKSVLKKKKIITLAFILLLPSAVFVNYKFF